MNAFIDSLKAELLNRRVLPFLIALGVALVAALAYAVLGGGSETPSAPTASAVTPGAGAAGIDVTSATTNPDKAIAETTSGRPKVRLHANDPFKPLPEPKAKSASTSSSGSSSSSSSSTSSSSGGSSASSSSPESSSSGSSSSSSSGSSSSGTPAPKTSKPAKPKPPAPVDEVDVQFGPVSTTPGQSTQLTPYNGLKPSAQVPSSTSPIVVYSGATKDGKSATFKLAAEVIVPASATCQPSATQCESIVLKPGQSVELSYLPPNGGATVVYKLELVSLTPLKASAAKAHKASAAKAHKAAVARARKASAAKSHR
jgi:hypothetical protein